MSMMSILARVDGTENDQAVLDSALQVATRFKGHIEALHVRFDPRDLPLVTGYDMVPEVVALTETLKRTADRAAEQARSTFEAWRAANKIPLVEAPGGAARVSVRWQEDAGNEEDVVIRRGRLADLIVVARPTVETSSVSQNAVEAALFDTRRPVLITPPTLRGDLFGPALVAWNGSAEASAAVALAMPLLAAAKEVGVFTAVEAKHRGEAEELIAYLGWQGIAAKREATGSTTGGVGADLLAVAEATGAGLIVMGGYTHGRVRQIVFGGVTSHVLHHAALPVLMAH